MIAPPAGLAALYADDVDGEPVQWTEPVVWLDGSATCPAVVLDDDGKPTAADSLDCFAGLAWRTSIVAALPGAGWRVHVTDDETLQVVAWLVRSDGHMLAGVVGQSSTMTFDPLDEDVRFVPPGSDK